MKSFTGNVFASTSREAIDKFLKLSQYKVNFSDFESALEFSEIESSIFCSPKKNKNLIDFEMNYGVDRKGYTIIMRLVETGSLFEAQFVQRDVYSQAISRILLDNEGVTDERRSTDLDRELIGQIKKYPKQMFFAFGVGEKISDWAGPFVAVFTKADFTINENGIREITLEFTNQEGKLLRNEIEGKRSNNIYSILDKYNNIYKNKKINLKVEEAIPYQKVLSEDIHYIIVNLIERYLISLINNANTSLNELNANILVLIPDLYSAFKEVASAKSISEGKVEELTVNEIGLIGTKKFQSIDPFSRTETINNNRGLNSKFEELKKQMESLTAGIDKRKAQIREAEAARANQSQATRNVNEFIELQQNNPLNLPFSFVEEKTGISIGGPPKALIRWFRQDVLGEDTNNYDELLGGYKKSIKIQSRNLDLVQEQIQELLQDVYLNIALKLDPTNKSSQTETTPDYYSPLSIMNSKLTTFLAKTLKYTYSPTFSMENDLRVLEVWQRYGLIEDSKKTTYLFGDESLIEDLLYASKSVTLPGAIQITTDKKFISKLDLKRFCTDKENFRAEMYEVRKKNRKYSSFGEKSNSKDDLSLDEFERSLVSNEAIDIPIFRHNINNANVLSLSITNDTTYYDVYDFAYNKKNQIAFIADPAKIDLRTLLGPKRENDKTPMGTVVEYEDPIQAVVGILVNSSQKGRLQQAITDVQNANKVKNITELVREQIKIEPDIQTDINKLYSFIIGLSEGQGTVSKSDNVLANTLASVSSYTFTDNEGNQRTVSFDLERKAAIISYLLMKKYKSPIGPQIEFLKQQELACFERDVFDKLSRTVQTLRIKTLPWFSISGYVTGQQAVVVGLSNIIGKTGKSSAFYNGLYYINGYKHVITPTEMYSEFLLSKHPQSQVKEGGEAAPAPAATSPQTPQPQDQ